MATVSLENVSKNYGQQPILSSINLSISKGEFVAVVGPSGCGKSTLLRLVSGLENLSSGRILISNVCVNSIPAAKRDMAMVFQSYALYPHMTVYDNMAYGLKMRKFSPLEIETRVQAAAKMLHLTDFLKRKPIALSGGQRQRVAMGRAIVRSPAVFLFDEPLSNLDSKLRSDLRHEIKKLHQHLKSTCIYVTHDQTEAMTLASKVVILNHGKIEQIASPQEVYQSPASLFVAGFTGLYPMNFFPASFDLTQNKIISAFPWFLPISDTALAQEFIVGVRPEHFSISLQAKDGSLAVKIDFIDDLGADKLIKVKTACGSYSFYVKTNADIDLSSNDLWIAPHTSKISLFDKYTGLRIGG